jgi:regulator of sigma E protease
MVIGFDKTGQFIQQTYITLLRLIQGTIKPSHLRGPVGIVDEGAKVAAQGFAYYLFFLGLISVNLAVINFLPIPIVDGGLMVFLMIEKIKGSPASPKVQTAAMLVGLVLIAVVFLYVTYQDIARIVEG